MEISKPGEFYEVLGTKGKYDVSLKEGTCSCPHFMHRLRKTRGECKHIIAAKEFAAGTAVAYDEIIRLLKEHVFIESGELRAQFSGEVIDRLASLGEIEIRDNKVSLPLV
jgi:hypothetical protein